MSSTLSFLLTIFFFFNPILAQHHPRAPFKPSNLVLPTHKDPVTNLYVAQIRKRSPQIPVPLLVDINGGLPWVTCDQHYYTSPTYRAPSCRSTQCSRAGVHQCHHNNTCGVPTTNPLTGRTAVSQLAADAVMLSTAEGSRWVTIRSFLFACAPSSLLSGPLPQGVRGIAGLGHTQLALPSQLTSNYGFPPRFFMCLPGSERSNGWIVFGMFPWNVEPTTLTYTPLTIGTNGEYTVRVKSIRVSYTDVPFNSSLFSRSRGFAATTFSTTTPYSILHRSIYQPFIQFYARQTGGVPRVQAVPPFDLCYNGSMLPPTRVGMPRIEFVFQNENANWTIYGYDALIRPRPEVACLGFVDGGMNARAAITIGAHHLEEDFFEFDLARSRMGFVPLRLGDVNTASYICSSLNFTIEPPPMVIGN